MSFLKQALASEPTNSTAELWLVLIGHGTFDGKEAKFNLRGPDLSATDLAEWLKPFRRPVVVINCASSSSPFINKLSAPGRVIVTATKSGYEQNYARFRPVPRRRHHRPERPTSTRTVRPRYSKRSSWPPAGVTEFYETEGRLATEHALLDDNGDGLGTPADFFRGVRAVKKPADGGAWTASRAPVASRAQRAGAEDATRTTRPPRRAGGGHRQTAASPSRNSGTKNTTADLRT